MTIRDAWDNYNAETDMLYSTPRILRPFHFAYLFFCTDCYRDPPPPPEPEPCDHVYHKVGSCDGGWTIIYECQICGDEYEKDVS